MNISRKTLAGPTLQDVCTLAAQSGFIIQIGIEPANKDRRPYRITINVYRGDDMSQQRAFCMDLDTRNPAMNAELGLRLMEYIDKVKSGERKSGILIPPGRIIGQA